MKRESRVKPFLKWVGGKTQLLGFLEARLPESIRATKRIDVYIEPFTGGGAFFFFLKNNYRINKAYLIDNNRDLILTYKVVRDRPEELIKEIKSLHNRYTRREYSERADYFYKIRDGYNKQAGIVNYRKFSEVWVKRAAFVIFLNKTCFNGLFRQNSNGEFNVPHGRYKNPGVYDRDNIREVSRALKGVRIIRADFEECRKYAKPGSFVYFDPPYRPLNSTSGFTSYTKDGFCDNEQTRLAGLFRELAGKGVYVLLSNSDPTNEDKMDVFFDEIYKGFNIRRVLASRMVNCNGSGRGRIRELLITNY